MKRALLRIGIAAAAFGGFTAPAQAQNGGFCMLPGGDSNVTDYEAKQEAKFCLVMQGWWTNGQYMTVVKRINGTAVKVQPRGRGLQPIVLVDWDPAWTDQTGKRQPAAYWISW